MKTKESEEMYLETILLLRKEKPSLHAIDIVDELGYAKSSVSHALKLLRLKEYITIDEDDVISFTPLGKQKAEEVYDRHKVLTDLFVRIGASPEVAEENACRIEHVVSADLFALIKAYMKR